MKNLFECGVGLFTVALFSISVFAADVSANKPTDPQIAEVVVTANKIDVDTAKSAEKKATNPQVKQFAREMVKQHSASNKEAEQLAQNLGMTPEPSPASKDLNKSAKRTQAKLMKAKGSNFDKEYINHEVKFHEQVLSEMDNNLIPNAKDPQLKALLEKTRPVIQAHLEHAKTIQKELG